MKLLETKRKIETLQLLQESLDAMPGNFFSKYQLNKNYLQKKIKELQVSAEKQIKTSYN